MILETGHFEQKNDNIHILTGIVYYKIEELEDELFHYKITFEYFSCIDNYWRRDGRNNNKFELYKAKLEWEINKDNSTAMKSYMNNEGDMFGDNLRNFRKSLNRNVENYFAIAYEKNNQELKTRYYSNDPKKFVKELESELKLIKIEKTEDMEDFILSKVIKAY